MPWVMSTKKQEHGYGVYIGAVKIAEVQFHHRYETMGGSAIGLAPALELTIARRRPRWR